MAYTQLRGRIFKQGDVNYLILEDNDFTSDSLWVKTVDSRRYVCEMPLQEVLQSLTGQPATRSGRRAA